MKEQNGKREILILSVYALALGIALSLTSGLHYQGIWKGPSQNYLQTGALQILKGICLAAPVFFVVFCLRRWIVPALSERLAPGEKKLSGRAFFGLCWGILLICRLPYLLSFFPGGVVGDAAETLEFAVETDVINSKWGVAQILAFRLFLALGRVFSPDVNVGIFLYSVATCLLYSAVCAAVIVTLRNKGIPRVLWILFLFVYAFSGHYGAYSISLYKDSLFGAGITAFSLLLWMEPEEGNLKRAWAVKIGIVLLFLCFWRNFVSYGLLAAGLLLLIFTKKKKKMLALVMLLVSLTSVFIQGPVYRALGISGQTSREMLAIPIQQVAAAIHEGAELNEEQTETLDHILPLEKWKERYAPSISDSIKMELDDPWLQAHVPEFLKVWVQLLFRHPGAYARAYLMETAGFWQPYGGNKGFYYDWYVGVQDLYDRGYTERDLLTEATGYSLRNSLKARMPFIPSGTMAWILLLSLALMLCRGKEKRRGILALVPFLCGWMGVMVSAPIAYAYRYVEMLALGFPLFACVPLAGGNGDAGLRPRTEGKAERIAARAVAMAAAVVMATVSVTGADRVYGFSDGKLEICTSGDRDNADYFIREGIDVAEDGFRWTNGDRFTVAFPYEGTERKLEATIHVRDTFNGPQRFVIRDTENREVFGGEITHAGEICFETEAGEQEAAFTVELPDAIRVSDVREKSTDTRRVALQVSGITIRQTGGDAADRAALPLYGKTVILAGDSRSSDDYTFYRETLERKAGCTAVTAGASGKTAAYNASDEYLFRILNRQHDYSVWLVGGNDDGSPGTVGTFDTSSALAAQGEPLVRETDAEGEYVGTTFIQAIDHIMRKYKLVSERSGKGKTPVIIFCTDLPQQRESADSPWSRRENWERKRLAILECCVRNGVACLDLYSLCGFDMTKEPMYVPPTDMVSDRGVYYMDGLHPNPRGIDVITDHEIRFMEELGDHEKR